MDSAEVSRLLERCGLPVDPFYHRRLVLVRAMNRPDELPVITSAW